MSVENCEKKPLACLPGTRSIDLNFANASKAVESEWVSGGISNSKTNGQLRCPNCSVPRPVSLFETYRQFTIWQCSVCQLQFANPIVIDDAAYTDAYADDASELARMASYAEHTRYGEWLARVPDVLPFLLPVERAALRWLRRHLKQNDHVLDFGCGVGRFLRALRQVGFHGYGLDIAEGPIKMLQDQGFAAARGGLDAYGVDWQSPQGIVCFEVLEHVPEPVGFLRSLRERFPAAPLLIAVPDSLSRRRFDTNFRAGDYPPNHLTRWTKKALEQALRQAGYKSKVTAVHVTGDELSLPESINPAIHLLLFRVFRRAITILNYATGDRLVSWDVKRATEATTPPWRDVAWRRLFHRYLLFPYVAWLTLRHGSRYWLFAVAQPAQLDQNESPA